MTVDHQECAHTAPGSRDWGWGALGNTIYKVFGFLETSFYLVRENTNLLTDQVMGFFLYSIKGMEN